MKSLKALLLIFLSVTLTGCYTQLQHSQKAKRITDTKSTPGYSWSGDEKVEENTQRTESDYGKAKAEEESYYDNSGEGEGLPVDYKDYDVVEEYEACNCNPYKTYVLIDDPYYYSAYDTYAYSGFHHRYYRPYHSHFGLGFSIGFGSSFYYSSFYHPYYYPPYHYPSFYYGYGGFFPSYNNFFFGSSFTGRLVRDRENRRFGRRSIGSSRVNSSGTSVNRTRASSGRLKASSPNRSTGRSRVRSANSRKTKVQGTKRSRGSSRVGVKRKRVRDNSSRLGILNNRSDNDRSIRLRKIRVKDSDNSSRRRSFFGNLGRVLRSSFNATSSSRSRTYSIPNHKSGRSRAVRSRGRSSGESSSVTRSRSSRSKSSGSRSGSSGGGKKRSRGN